MLLRAFARKGGVSITRPWLQPSSVLRSSPSLFITANNNSNCNGNLGNLSSIRGKHSATQIKRIFRNHPARLRVEERMGIEHSYLPLHPIQFPRIYEPPVVLPNGWSTPLPVEERPHYPFTVQRTKNKPMDAIGFLPVYTKHRYE